VQNADMRERMFTMRLSEEESTRLDKLAAHYGLNAAGLIRMVLKKEERALAVETAAPKPAKTKR
jgi:predicted DNA binding CopG/RHH family protein